MYADPVPVPTTFFDDYSTRSVSARRAAMRVADHLNSEDLKDDPPEDCRYEEQAVWKYQRFMQDYLACVALRRRERRPGHRLAARRAATSTTRC